MNQLAAQLKRSLVSDFPMIQITALKSIFLDSVTSRYYFHSDNVSSQVSSGRQVLPKSDWRDVVATIEEAAVSDSVFLRTMAYHLSTCLTSIFFLDLLTCLL
jgi:hypothetical protein